MTTSDSRPGRTDRERAAASMRRELAARSLPRPGEGKLLPALANTLIAMAAAAASA